MEARLNEAHSPAPAAVPSLSIVASPELLGLISRSTGIPLALINLDEWLDAHARLIEASQDVPAPTASMDVLNHTVLGVIVSASSSLEIREKAREQARALDIPFLMLDCHDIRGDPILGWIAQRVYARMTSAERSAALERQASARIRRDFMDLQRNFTDVEAFLYSLGAPRFFLAYETVAETSELSVQGRLSATPNVLASEAPADAGQSEILQRLPVSCRALVAVDLQFTALPDDPSGAVELDLIDLAGAPLVAATRRPLSECGLGDNRFQFDSGIDSFDKDCALRIRIGANAGQTVALALGAMSPLEQFVPTLDGRPTGDRVLALKVWKGLARTTLPAPSRHILSERATARRTALLMPGDLPRPRKLRAPPDAENFIEVTYWHNENAVLVHPSALGIVIGILEGLDVKNVSSVSAAVNVSHPSAPTLGFALALLPAGHARSLADPAAALGEWLLLPPRGWGHVHHHLDRPLSGKADLLLGSCIAHSAVANWSWALFRAFRFTLASERGSP